MAWTSPRTWVVDLSKLEECRRNGHIWVHRTMTCDHCGITHEELVRGRDRPATWDDVDEAAKLANDRAWQHYRVGFVHGRKKGRKVGVKLSLWLLLRRIDRDSEAHRARAMT